MKKKPSFSWIIAVIIAIVLALPPVFRIFSDEGLRWVWLLDFSTALSYVLVFPAGLLSIRLGIMDIPGGRKKHDEPTPLLGGAAVFLSFIAALFVNGIITPVFITVISASTLILLVGIMEDWFGVSEWIRLCAQAAAFIMVAMAGVHLNLFFPTPIGQALNLLLSFLWVVGITNAMNFIDGMDGLCGGVSTIIAFFLGSIAFFTSQTELGWLSVTILGATLGFLPYNFIPRGKAKIFLGDAGSSFLGFVLACLALIGEWSDNDPLVSFSTPLLIFGVLIYDTAYTNISRIVTGKVRGVKALLAFVGRDHVHHRMEMLLGDRHLAVVFLVIVNAIFGCAALALRGADRLTAVFLIIQALLILLLISLIEIGFKDKA